MPLLNWLSRNWLIATGFLLVLLMLLKRALSEATLELSSFFMTIFAFALIIVLGQVMLAYTRLRFLGWTIILLGVGFGLFFLAGLPPTISIPGIPELNIQEALLWIDPWLRLGLVFVSLGIIFAVLRLLGLARLFIVIGAAVLLFLLLLPETVVWIRSKADGITLRSTTALPTHGEKLFDGGVYTITNDKWLVFGIPEDHCIGLQPSAGVNDLRKGDNYFVRSYGEPMEVVTYILDEGETLGTYTCQ